MRTARLLTVSHSIPCIFGGGVWPTPLMQTPPWRPAQDPLPGGRLGRGVSSQPHLDANLPGCRPPGGRTPPPLTRMTDVSKNITLPQTSFAGGKYLFLSNQYIP